MLMRIIILLLLCFQVLFVSAQYSFEFTYGTDEDELLVNAVEDYSDNVILVGRIGYRSTRDYDPLIIKVKPDGSYISKRIISGDTNGYFKTINLLQDSTYLLTGSYGNLNGVDLENLWVCKMDTNLNIIYDKSYNLVEGSMYFSMATNYSLIDNENNIVLAGAKSYEQFTDMLLIKLNQDGDTLVTRTHHFQFEQTIMNISCIPNTNDYMGIVGLIDMHNYGPIRFDSVFNIIDIKHLYNSTGIKNKGSSDHWINDTTYMYSALSIVDHENRIVVYNLDTALRYHNSLVLDKTDTIDYPAWRNSMAYANDSTVYIGGFICSIDFYPTHPNAIELYVIDTGLNLLGYKEYGWDANYDVWGIIATSDDGCLLYGNRRTPDNTTESDVYIRKVLREEFDIVTTIKEVDINNSYSTSWPNPVSSNLFIKLFNTEATYLDLRVLNMSGKEMTRRRVYGKGNVLEINVQPLSSGIYIYHITLGTGQVISGKFIKIN